VLEREHKEYAREIELPEPDTGKWKMERWKKRSSGIARKYGKDMPADFMGIEAKNRSMASRILNMENMPLKLYQSPKEARKYGIGK